jgi:hypothetical protein
MVGTPRMILSSDLLVLSTSILMMDTPSPFGLYIFKDRTNILHGPHQVAKNRLKPVFQIVLVIKGTIHFTFFKVGTSHPFKRHPVLKQIGR